MENNLAEKYAHIKGWGIDADPKNEPTYPMKHYTGDDHKRSNWVRPPLQNPDFEVLKSTERPTLSAVVGESTPPSGLSGVIRRYAFTFSENRLRRWLLLIAADKVNVMEGIVTDLITGHVPNIPSEKGIGADWKYNRTGLLTKMAITTVLVAGAGAALYYTLQNNDEEDSEESQSRNSRSNNNRAGNRTNSRTTSKSKK